MVGGAVDDDGGGVVRVESDGGERGDAAVGGIVQWLHRVPRYGHGGRVALGVGSPSALAPGWAVVCSVAGRRKDRTVADGRSAGSTCALAPVAGMPGPGLFRQQLVLGDPAGPAHGGVGFCIVRVQGNAHWFSFQARISR